MTNTKMPRIWAVWLAIGLSLTVFCVRHANASNSAFEIYQNLVKANQLEEAERVLKSILEKEKDPEQRTLATFAMGVLSQKQKKDTQAVAKFDEALAGKSDLADLIRIHKGISLRALGLIKEAREEFMKAEAVQDKSRRAFYEAEFELGEIEMMDKRWAAAAAHFQKLERKMRSDEKYPAILLNLVRIENSRAKRYNSCKWARKLYSKFPYHPLVATWSIDLQSVTVDDKPLQCVANLNDQRSRIRNLQLQGLSEKAKAEIGVLKSRSIDSTMHHVDALLATYYLSEGLPQDAMNVLMPYYKKEGRDFAFFVLLGRVAAQTGEFQKSVEAYERAHKLSPRSKAGKGALFQAAFLSYQFQDYEGAGKKFEDFIKKYPRSGLSADARWHLAWIKYLKKDYGGAYDGFKALWKTKSKKNRSLANEKTLYWTAMSLVRLGRITEAMPILEQITQDKGFGYYYLVAKARLQILKAQLDVRQTASQAQEKIDPKLEEAPVVAAKDEEAENEDELDVDSDDDAADAKEETEAAAAPEPAESPFQNAKMAKRFKRANDLIAIGLNQWATWELYEIERRTAQQSHLNTLISRYESIESYYRSAYISYVYFTRQRIKEGMKDGKPIWLGTYPRAYERSVSNFSRSYNVPEEFVWAIMRAESQFKPDIKSPVGALGLMQLMPYTAGQVAKMLSFSEFTTPQLFEPATNIRLGTRYLQRLLKQFEQTVPLAAAAYNAGPHRVRAWLKSFGNNLDMDEFVEHIPYLETRNYVKKVVHNYFVYRQLYNKSVKNDELLSWLAKPVGIKVTGDVESRERWD